jgi:hypothetical protein
MLTTKYARDPRNDFFNWSIIDQGAFDYAANAWGYTYGAAAEWYQDWWTARAGVFDLSTVPNGLNLSPNLRQGQFVAELEERHNLWNQPGKLKLLYWLTRGDLGASSTNSPSARSRSKPTMQSNCDARASKRRTFAPFFSRRRQAQGWVFAG